MFLGTSEPCDDPVDTKNVLTRFLPAFTFAHRALCAAAIWFRAAAESVGGSTAKLRSNPGALEANRVPDSSTQ
jgi:hypothetical protein